MAEKRVIKIDDAWSKQQQEVARQEELAYERYRNPINQSYSFQPKKNKTANTDLAQKQEDYIKRLQEYNKQKYADIRKRNKRKGLKSCIKEKVLGLVKATSLFTLSVAGVATCYFGGLYMSAASDGLLDFNDDVIKQNQNIKAGYYNEKPLVISIKGFTEEKQQLIGESLDYMNSVCEGLTFEYKLDDGTKDYDIKVYEQDFSGTSLLGQATWNSLTQSRRLSGSVRLSPTLQRFQFKSVFIHELMHVLGFYHVKTPFSLMFPTQTRYKLTQFDIDRINAVYPSAEKQTESEEYQQVRNKQSAFFTYEPEETQQDVELDLTNEEAQQLLKAFEDKLNNSALTEQQKQDIISDMKQIQNKTAHEVYYETDDFEME